MSYNTVSVNLDGRVEELAPMRTFQNEVDKDLREEVDAWHELA